MVSQQYNPESRPAPCIQHMYCFLHVSVYIYPQQYNPELAQDSLYCVALTAAQGVPAGVTLLVSLVWLMYLWVTKTKRVEQLTSDEVRYLLYAFLVFFAWFFTRKMKIEMFTSDIVRIFEHDAIFMMWQYFAGIHTKAARLLLLVLKLIPKMTTTRLCCADEEAQRDPGRHPQQHHQEAQEAQAEAHWGRSWGPAAITCDDKQCCHGNASSRANILCMCSCSFDVLCSVSYFHCRKHGQNSDSEIYIKILTSVQIPHHCVQKQTQLTELGLQVCAHFAYSPAAEWHSSLCIFRIHQ